MNKEMDTTLYFITDSTGYEKEEFLRRVEAALQGGVTLVQLREKERSTREYLELAQEVHVLTQKYNVPLIIDDRLDVAMAAEVEGVHLGQSDLPVDKARKILGNDRIITVFDDAFHRAFCGFLHCLADLFIGGAFL